MARNVCRDWPKMGFANYGECRLYLYGIMDRRKVFSDINDYRRVDDFYSKLHERNSYVESHTSAIDDIALRKLNKECLDLAEDALKNVDWSKYR